MNDGPPRTLETLLLYLHDHQTGEVWLRRDHLDEPTQPDQRIIDDIEAILRRPLTPEDVNLDVATMMFTKWRRDDMRPRDQRTRLRWFHRLNAVAVHLDWAERIDFSVLAEKPRKHWAEDTLAMPIAPEVERGDVPQMSLVELFDTHYRMERLLGKSKNTDRLYHVAIRQLSGWLGRPALVSDLDTQTLTSFASEHLSDQSRSIDTVTRNVKRYLALWRYARSRGMLSTSPNIRLPQAPDRVPDSWSRADLDALMLACHETPGMVGTVPADLFWPALVSVVYNTAERIGAIMATRRSDLSTSGYLVIRGEHRKGKRRDKAYPLRPKTVERLNATYRYDGGKMLIPWPYCEAYIWPKFNEVVARAGLSSTRRDKFHKLRRTVATLYDQAGGNATELLDHDSRETTKKHYIDPTTSSNTETPADIALGIGERPPEPTAKPQMDDDTLAKIRALLDGAA